MTGHIVPAVFLMSLLTPAPPTEPGPLQVNRLEAGGFTIPDSAGAVETPSGLDLTGHGVGNSGRWAAISPAPQTRIVASIPEEGSTLSLVGLGMLMLVLWRLHAGESRS